MPTTNLTLKQALELIELSEISYHLSDSIEEYSLDSLKVILESELHPSDIQYHIDEYNKGDY